MRNHFSKSAAVCPWTCTYLASCLWILGDASHKVQLLMRRSAVPPMPQASKKIPSPGETPQGGFSCPTGNSPSGGPRQRVGRGMRAATRKLRIHKRPTRSLDTRFSVKAGLCVSGHRTFSPAFLFSQKSVPKSRFLPASPRGKQFSAPAGRWKYEKPPRKSGAVPIDYSPAGAPPSPLGLRRRLW